MSSKRISYTALTALLLLSLVAGIYLIRSERETSTPSISLRTKSHRRIGVVDVSGEIYFPTSDAGFSSVRGAERIVKTLKRYRKDDSIKAIVLRINSPGGSIGAVQEIVSEIHRIKDAEKPIVSSVADLGASGGYYIAAPTDKIVANKGSLIGSIGVIMASGDFSRLMDKLGIKFEVIKSGEFKDAGSFHRPLSGAEKEHFQQMVDDAFQQFITAVSSGREMPLEDVRELARGQIYTGRRAKELKLIDKLGDLTSAVELAEELAGIKDAEVVREKYYNIGTILRIFGQQKNIFGFPAQDKFSGISYLYAPR